LEQQHNPHPFQHLRSADDRGIGLVANVGLLANDANQAKKFLEVASTGQPAGNADFTKLSDGVANTKVLCTTRRTNKNALIHQLELENAMIDSIEGKTIPAVQLLLSQAEILYLVV
jgi:hypothetical protein